VGVGYLIHTLLFPYALEGVDPLKCCAHCGKVKGEEEFNWRWEDQDTRESICRSCQVGDRKDWYDAHINSEKARTAEIKRKTREEATRFVYEYLSYSTCKDYGEYDFAVLMFDHVRGNMIYNSIIPRNG
jgi:hypothetical protein